MAKFATGKYAKAISDRSGMEFPYKEMVREWNGSFVHVSEFEPKQPQLEPKPMNGDSISIRNVRPDRSEPATPNLLPLNAFTTTNGSATVSVNEPNHGRSTSDTVRFRDAELVQAMKLYYEDELARALAEDGSASSTYITPKAYYPST